MENLKKLLSKCNSLDVYDQIYMLGDADLPANAQKELDALETQLVQYQTANDELQADRERLANELETCRASLDSLVDGLR